MADLNDFVGECQVNFRSFADDSQTYLHCLLGDVDSVVCQLEGCIAQVGHWMSANRLKLNTNKIELVWTGSRHKLNLLEGCSPSLQYGDDVIKRSDHVRLLGVTIAAGLSLHMHQQVQPTFHLFLSKAVKHWPRTTDLSASHVVCLKFFNRLLGMKLYTT